MASRTQEMTLIGIVSAMFLTNLVLIGLLIMYASRLTDTDYRYELLKEDYTRLIQQSDRDWNMRYGRVQEQLSDLQFTMDRRFGLIEDREYLKRHSQE